MIAHIAYSGVGGTGSFVGDLCPGLDRYGDPSHVIFYGVEALHSDYGTRLAGAGIRYTTVTKKPGADFASLYSLAREIRCLRPKLVVMHGGGTAWHWPLLRILGVRARLVLVEHGPEISWSYTRHIISILCADTVIAISQALADSLRTRFGFFLGSRPLWTIPNGVDTDFFSPIDAPRARNIILNVATLSPVKDQATLIRACALMADHRDVHLFLAGGGVMRSRLEQVALESGITDRVTFLGNVGRDRLLELYRQTGVFVLSTRGEGISLAMLEAMACGSPIVASDAPGVTEILTGTGCAILVPQEDPAGMASAMESILDNSELGARMSTRARQCATAHYSTNRMTARYREILNSI